MNADSAALFESASEVVRQAQTAVSKAPLELAVRACFSLARSGTPEERKALLERLAPGLDVPLIEHALLVGYWCGAMVEDGTDGASIEQPLLRRYLELARAAREFHDARALSSTDVDAEALAVQHWPPAYSLLATTTAPAVAVLAASDRARAYGRPLADALAPLSALLPGVTDIVTLARVLDDEPYLVLEPSSLTGIRGRMSGVSDNAQLLLLLMAAFPRPDHVPVRVSQQIVDNARGLGPQRLRTTATAAFSLQAWTAARPSGMSEEPKDAQLLEARPDSIPVFEGARALLLGVPRHTRTWAVAREFKGLRADLTVDEILHESAVRALLLRMSAARS